MCCTITLEKNIVSGKKNRVLTKIICDRIILTFASVTKSRVDEIMDNRDLNFGKHWS